MGYTLLGGELAEVFELSVGATSADLWKRVSPLHHCVIAWSVSDWSVRADGTVEVSKPVKSYEIESRGLSPRGISVVVTVKLCVVVIDHAPLGS